MNRAVWLALVTLPAAGLALLLARPRLDVEWEHHPAHFWLVVLAGALTFALGFLLGEAAGRRADARVLLVSLAFLAAAGFLVLHALATPGVLLAGTNAGFQVASPIGLALASAFAAASALELRSSASALLVRRRRVLHAALLVILAAWAALSLAGLPPLDAAVAPEEARGPLLALAVAGAAAYGFAAARYYGLYGRRPRPLLVAIVTAFVLLAEAMFAVALARNWHATWWEWHLLMLVAFAVVAVAARREWRTEGSTAEIFSDLYEEATRGDREDASILFADLQGFTSFSERTPPDEVKAMLDEYWNAAAPTLHEHGGEIDKTIGDAVMVTFRGEGHVRRAALGALAFQRETARLADRHPGWPRFRAGINSGEAVFGVVDARGRRAYTATGDVVNVAARLEGHAHAGQVVIGEATRQALGRFAAVADLGDVPLKGREKPVRAYVLERLPAEGRERDERLEEQEREPAG